MGAACSIAPTTVDWRSRAFGAHSWKRLAHVGDRTGLELIRTCQDKLVHTAGTQVPHGVHTDPAF